MTISTVWCHCLVATLGYKQFYLLLLLHHQYKWSTQWKSLRIMMKIVLCLGTSLPRRISGIHVEQHC